MYANRRLGLMMMPSRSFTRGVDQLNEATFGI